MLKLTLMTMTIKGGVCPPKVVSLRLGLGFGTEENEKIIKIDNSLM